MSKFGEVLREYISKNGYSINEFAGKCKIDRAWLSNVLSGRKELSEAKFDNILKSKLLSESQNENLIALYRLKDFSSDQVERMEYIMEHLSRKIRRNDSIAPIKYDENRRMYLGKANLLSVLYRIIENKDELSFIYTNIPTEAEESLDVLYDFLKHDDYKKIDYKHIFLTDNGVSIHNISTYFTICDFAELGYTDFSVIKDVELNSLNTNDFFPYFIITDKKIMLFDAEFNNAIVSFDDKIINVHTRKFMALYEKGENPVTSFSNAVELMRTLTSMHNSSSELSFTPDFCVTPCLDYDILNKNATPNLPDKELLIRAVLNHYNIDYSHFSNFVTIESINRFAKDGIIYEIPRDYLLPVDVESRIKLLKSVKDNIDNNGKYKTYILNPTKFNYNSYDIQVEKIGVLTVCGIRQGNKDNIQSFMGEWLCSIDDENIFKDFMNLEKYLIESKIVYSDEFSSQYVSNIILELSAQHSKGEM